MAEARRQRRPTLVPGSRAPRSSCGRQPRRSGLRRPPTVPIGPTARLGRRPIGRGLTACGRTGLALPGGAWPHMARVWHRVERSGTRWSFAARFRLSARLGARRRRWWNAAGARRPVQLAGSARGAPKRANAHGYWRGHVVPDLSTRCQTSPARAPGPTWQGQAPVRTQAPVARVTAALQGRGGRAAAAACCCCRARPRSHRPRRAPGEHERARRAVGRAQRERGVDAAGPLGVVRDEAVERRVAHEAQLAAAQQAPTPPRAARDGRRPTAQALHGGRRPGRLCARQRIGHAERGRRRVVEVERRGRAPWHRATRRAPRRASPGTRSRRGGPDGARRAAGGEAAARLEERAGDLLQPPASPSAGCAPPPRTRTNAPFGSSAATLRSVAVGARTPSSPASTSAGAPASAAPAGAGRRRRRDALAGGEPERAARWRP